LAGAEVLDFIRSRRSVRRFQPDVVPPDTINRILETAMWAPSAHNRQPWRFVVLQNDEGKVRLAGSMATDFQRDLMRDGLPTEEVERQVERSRQRILEAPVVIVLCLDPAELDIYPDPDRTQAEYIMAVQSVAMAGCVLMLAAHANGLGSVWMCAPLFAPASVVRALDLPSSWKPQGMVLAGYPARFPRPRPRRPLSEVARFL
jgi:coenzyme F420-0:L-glutamate ligase / coenzyme F420-1:gamma-L-glutamate ligase